MTDRAKRYRAHRNPPPAPKRCNFCASRKNVDIDHVTGNESDDHPDNKMWLCRPCNTTKGITQSRNRIGVRTAQFNPAKPATFAQFKIAAAVLLGLVAGDVAKATALIRATPAETRTRYAERIEKAREKNPVPTYAQYAHGVSIHQRKAYDEGGAIIHATPASLRHKYALQIARTKRQRGEIPF